MVGGTWRRGVGLGKLEGCQGPLDSAPVRPGPVRGLSRPLGRYMIRSYISFMFLRLHLLNQPVCAVWKRSGGVFTENGWSTPTATETDAFVLVFNVFFFLFFQKKIDSPQLNVHTGI